MNNHYVVPGTDNVVDLKKYRTFQDMKKLFEGYKKRVLLMKFEEVSEERNKLKEEMKRYPNHALTTVKRQIFENATNTKI